MFVDEGKIFVKGGDGGRGCVSFRREKYVPKGGPDGGDGGRGGHVRLVADAHLNTLNELRYRQFYEAPPGSHGMGKAMHGRDGADCCIRVPVGTQVRALGSPDLVADLDRGGMECLVARGGRGGRGNTHFRSSTNRTPYYAEEGERGESRWLLLELKLLADVGIIGLPNVGKSTLLSCLTDARPKIAAYPFTTLVPCVGVMWLGEHETVVMADVPGLIEGAHRGKGLGIRFLRHIERTRILVHLVDLSLPTAEKIYAGYIAVREELSRFNPDLACKPQVVAGNKLDLPGAPERFGEFCRRLTQVGTSPLAVSCYTGGGIPALREAVAGLLRQVGRTWAGCKAAG